MFKKLVFLTLFSILSLFTYAQNRVRITTSEGIIEVVLYKETPKHRLNFIKLAKKGYYDSTTFHRVISEFMIQGGDPQSKPSSNYKAVGNGGPGYTIDPEFNSKFIHRKGALAAARQGDDINPEQKSSGSQFYIVVGRQYPEKYMESFEEKNGLKYTKKQKETYAKIGGTPHLDGAYTVFGQVVGGMDVVDRISKIETGRADRPKSSVYILKMEIIE